MIDGAWQAGWAVGACDKLNLFTGVGLVEVGGRYSYEDVVGLFGFSLPSWYGYAGVGACDYGWMYEAVIGISYVGGHCQNYTACGCCAYAHAGIGSIPWFLGAWNCDRFEYKLYDDISYAIVSNVAGDDVGRCGMFYTYLYPMAGRKDWRVGA